MTAEPGVPVGGHHPTSGAPARPSEWLMRWLPALPKAGQALDVACGQGRNSLAVLAHGLTLTAVDRDAASLALLRQQAQLSSLAQDQALRTVQVDLEQAPWHPEPWAVPGGFDLIVVCNYLHRPRLSLLANLLKPGGWWIYETFMQGNEQYGRPRHPDFLLAPGELLRQALQSQMQVIGFEQGQRLTGASGAVAIVQRIAARRAATTWATIS